MWFPGRIRHVAAVDIKPALDALNKLDESVWSADEETKKYLAGDRPTQSLFFYSMTREEYASIVSERPIDQADVKKLYAYDLLYKDFSYLFEAVQEYYPRGGVFLRAQIACMPPGGVIKEHRDSLMILENSHRLHIPIVTTSKLKFVVDDERVSLKEGQLYELNNQLKHWVKNPANSINRIHLILDYLPPEYNIPASSDENFKFFIREHRMNRSSKRSDLSIDLPKVIALVANSAQYSDIAYSLHEIDFSTKSSREVFNFASLNAGNFKLDEKRAHPGITVCDKCVVLAVGNALYFLGKDFELEKSESTPLLSNACSLAYESGYIYVASPGTDSIVRFDTRKNIFDTAWLFYVDDSNKIAVRKEVVDSDHIPTYTNKFAINSIEVSNGTLYVAGENLNNMLVVGDGVINSGEPLPSQSTSVINFNKGIAFSNPAMHRVAYMTDHDFRVVNSDALYASNSGTGNFSSGLCRYKKGTLLVGTQPAGVALLDMKNQAVIAEVLVDDDNASAVIDVDLIK